ncbi:hypothetical protein GCM10009633_19180 [Janibacter melonis]|uniref:DUF7878 domain-containing protein n=1 Tax=Janibacter melonis TaxID=262209 RepID=UPI001E2DF5A9|nr:hypothetical protein [Janibacter melonis]MCB5991764.1 hypothetical protein [Janibacter melonis]
MKLTFANLKQGDAGGNTPVEYLIAVEAELLIYQDEVPIFREEYFPVAELASSLWGWLQDGIEYDFSFNSMSYEEEAIIALRQDRTGWLISSSFAPGLLISSISPTELKVMCERFIREVHQGLIVLGINPYPVLYK